MKLRTILNELLETQELSQIATDPKYDEFFNWLIRFQNQKTAWVPPEYAKFKDEFELVNPTKNYKCYRGLFFRSPSKEIKNLKVGNIIADSGTSWSLNYETAIQFARDDHHAFGGTAKWIEGKSIGIVIERTFSKDEIMCDLSHMYENGFKGVEYPKEKEVIVFKKLNNCKIVEILTKRMRNRRNI